MAAYAARAGLQAYIFMPRDTPHANMEESRIVGAEVALVLSAEVEVPAATPGSNVRLRLVYRALGGLTTDLKEFVHLYSPELGLAGQVDTTPGAGLNPTSSWQSGEIVVEELVIPVSSEAAPGTYSLLVGYYDPVTGERVYVRTRDGREPPDRTVDVEPIAIAR